MQEYDRKYKQATAKRRKEIIIAEREVREVEKNLNRLNNLSTKDGRILRLIEILECRQVMATDRLAGYRKLKKELDEQHIKNLTDIQEMITTHGEDVAELYVKEML